MKMFRKFSKGSILRCSLIVAAFILLFFVYSSIKERKQSEDISNVGESVEPQNEYLMEVDYDYSLIFQDEFYLLNNSDIVFEDTTEAGLLQHFIDVGMDSGLVASKYFDVWYYKESNGDLSELFGDNLKEYYLHYMTIGYNEGRPGSPYIRYELVFDSKYYLENNPDIVFEDTSETELLRHFIDVGMDKGLVASKYFDVWYYKENNGDLSELFGDNLREFYLHYMATGYDEGRYGSLSSQYALVFDSGYYLENNPDIVFEDTSKRGLLLHFIDVGMDKGLVASERFDVQYYKNSNGDLSELFGDNLKEYYLHYMGGGYKEGRYGSPFARYDLVFDSKYYLENNPDIVFEDTSENGLLQHFFDVGMDEGLIASEKFDVQYYKDNNGDLSELLGDNLKKYYLHYMTTGYDEGRYGSPFARYDLVFDSEYYLENNPDIVFENTSESGLLQHFFDVGMDKGLVASEYFDVWHYRHTYADLEELCGEDMKEYYRHYLSIGYDEGRSGDRFIKVRTESACEIVCEMVSGGRKLGISIGQIDESVEGKTYYVYRLSACEDSVEGKDYVAKGVLLGNQQVILDEYGLTDKYVVVIKKNDKENVYSNVAYISNPEYLCDTDVKKPVADSKKGLQIERKYSDVISELNPSHYFVNIYIDLYMTTEASDGDSVIEYEYKGKKYFLVRERIEWLDNLVSEYTKDGNIISVSLLYRGGDNFKKILTYPDATRNSETVYYAINTSTEEGKGWFEAFVSFLSERYNGTNEEYGLISNWTIGNEVNDGLVYNYMGEKDIVDYLAEYTRTFRIAYNIIKSNIDFATIYVPMEPYWGIVSDDLIYGGKEFVDLFNEVMKQGGHCDWGLAYHAYSVPLSDPKVLNDGEITIDDTGLPTIAEHITTDSEYSVVISMKNIEVLIEYMKKSEFLLENGEMRSIIMAEQGYTANSNIYGKCEAQQAASMLYAYYKSEMIDEIDAFVYFCQVDSDESSTGNNYYRFGLSYIGQNGKVQKRHSYDVYRLMDTKSSLNELSYMKSVLGISEWEEIIPEFDPSVFDNLKDTEYSMVHKIDISSAVIDQIPAVSYTGEECFLELMVRFNGDTLINDVDYDIVYLNNTNKGSATALIVGMNDYYGVKCIDFMIE